MHFNKKWQLNFPGYFIISVKNKTIQTTVYGMRWRPGYLFCFVKTRISYCTLFYITGKKHVFTIFSLSWQEHFCDGKLPTWSWRPETGRKLVPWGTDGRLPLSDLDLDLGSGHTAYRRASLIDLYLRTKFHGDRKKIFFESHHWGFGQVQSHVTQKLGQISKIRPDQI